MTPRTQYDPFFLIALLLLATMTAPLAAAQQRDQMQQMRRINEHSTARRAEHSAGGQHGINASTAFGLTESAPDASFGLGWRTAH